MLPAELQQPILDRAGGNPLYAEEFVRLLKDRDLLVRRAQSWELREGVEVPFPESVQALIAARLDTLEPEAKSLLADAAVIGKVFWAGAVAAMGDRDLQTVTTTLRELSRKELVRPSRQSSMAGEAEYAFWHVLARDVAYNQLPRASRATRHVAAAAWIESKAPERVEDLADVLAYHYATALDLAHAAGQHRAGSRVGSTRSALPRPRRRARTRFGHRRGTRELRAGAERSPPRATRSGLPRWPASARPPSKPGAPSRRRKLWRRRSTAFQTTGDPSRRRPGDRHPRHGARPARRSTQHGRCPPMRLALLEPLPPGPDHVAALTEAARAEALQGRHEAGIDYAEQALSLAAQLGLPKPARALGYRGLARCQLGDRGGLDDFREAIALATEAGQGREVALLHNNLAIALWPLEGPSAALEVMRAGIAFTQARGLTGMTRGLTANMLDALVETGEHEQALDLASELATASEASGNLFDLNLRTGRAGADPDPARPGQPDREHTRLARSHQPRGRQHRSSTSSAGGSAAIARVALAQPDHAAALLAEIDATPGSRENRNYPLCCLRWSAPPSPPTTANSPTSSQPASNPTAPTTSTPSLTATAALSEANGHHQDTPPTVTPTPRNGGEPSVSCPSRRSPS